MSTGMKDRKKLFDQNSAVDLRMVIGLNRSVNLLGRRAGQIFRKHGLTTMQFAVLEALYHKSDLRIGEIIEKVLTTGGNMTVVINNLEKQQLVHKRCAPTDSRAFVISLTESGRARLEAVFPEYLEDMQKTMSVLSDDEKTAVVKALRKLCNQP